MKKQVKDRNNQPSFSAMDKIAQDIRSMRFKKKIFGGVDEADVWRKIELLHKEYEKAFLALAMSYEMDSDGMKDFLVSNDAAQRSLNEEKSQ
ncbi:MAG: hypothetical protein IJV62_01355 [Eggerthellaceae bacterium]|nr:hypothetical protein [Eggerthellaceae bacterium]